VISCRMVVGNECRARNRSQCQTAYECLYHTNSKTRQVA
jgi:hypothetical protein